MKKILCIISVLLIVIISSCNETSIKTDNPVSMGKKVSSNSIEEDITDVDYSISKSTYFPYRNAKELIKNADVVLVGMVTNISFEVLDVTTALAPTEKTEERDRWLHTIYDVDVITLYKGKTSDKIKFDMSGGVEDYKVEEQLELIKKMNAWPNNAIRIESDTPEIKIGETYLFTLRQFEVADYTKYSNMIPQQSIYNLKNPLRKNPSDYYFDPQYPSDYYDKSENENGSPLISAKDIISFFGEDKWESFWNQWTKENPDWEKTLYEPAYEVVDKDEENSFVVDWEGNIIRQGAY